MVPGTESRAVLSAGGWLHRSLLVERLPDASALNTPLHMESDPISLGLASNTFTPLHAPLLPIAPRGTAGCISQEGRGAGWLQGCGMSQITAQEEQSLFPDWHKAAQWWRSSPKKWQMRKPNLQLQHPLSTAVTSGPQALGCGCFVPPASLMRCPVPLGSHIQAPPTPCRPSPVGVQAPLRDPGQPCWGWGCPWQVGAQQPRSPSLGL